MAAIELAAQLIFVRISEMKLRHVAALTSICLASCDGGIADQPAIETTGMLLYPAPSTVDSLVPDLRIGTESGRTEEAFGRVSDIEVGHDGSIYVLDGSAGAVRVFGPDGEYLHSLGRKGDGPAEFSRPTQMAVAPDGALWVYDEGLRAVVVLALDGLETMRGALRSSGPPVGVLSAMWDGVIDGDGKVIQTVQHTDPLPSTDRGVYELQNRIFVRTTDIATNTVDSVHVSTGSVRRFLLNSPGPGGGMGVMTGVVVFDPRTLIARDGGGNIWTALSTEYVLHRTSPMGDSLAVKLNVGERPVGAEEQSAWERLEEMQAGIAPPERAHLLWRLFTDDENRLWVQRADAFSPTNHFEIFDQDGGFLGSVALPGRTALFATVVRGGNLYTVTLDDLDVPTVVRAPLPRFR